MTELGNAKLMPLVVQFEGLRFAARHWERRRLKSGKVLYRVTRPDASVIVRIKSPDCDLERIYYGAADVIVDGNMVHLPPATRPS